MAQTPPMTPKLPSRSRTTRSGRAVRRPLAASSTRISRSCRSPRSHASGSSRQTMISTSRGTGDDRAGNDH